MCILCIYVHAQTHTALHKHRLTLVSRNNHQTIMQIFFCIKRHPSWHLRKHLFSPYLQCQSCDRCSLPFHTGIKKAPRSLAMWVTTWSQGKWYANALLRCHTTLGLGPESIQWDWIHEPLMASFTLPAVRIADLKSQTHGSRSDKKVLWCPLCLWF